MEKECQSGPDIVGLMGRIKEQLDLLDNKVDLLISRSVQRPGDARPANASLPGPSSTSGQAQVSRDHRFRERVMHKAVCADCKKGCEVPFKPSGDRPVYCQDCFSRRKTGGMPKPVQDSSKEQPVVKAALPRTALKKTSRVEKKKKPAPQKAQIRKAPAPKKKKRTK
jgi:CxxC-x17-CxxC domain-containing protein